MFKKICCILGLLAVMLTVACTPPAQTGMSATPGTSPTPSEAAASPTPVPTMASTLPPLPPYYYKPIDREANAYLSTLIFPRQLYMTFALTSREVLFNCRLTPENRVDYPEDVLFLNRYQDAKKTFKETGIRVHLGEDPYTPKGYSLLINEEGETLFCSETEAYRNPEFSALVMEEARRSVGWTFTQMHEVHDLVKAELFVKRNGALVASVTDSQRLASLEEMLVNARPTDRPTTSFFLNGPLILLTRADGTVIQMYHDLNKYCVLLDPWFFYEYGQGGGDAGRTTPEELLAFLDIFGLSNWPDEIYDLHQFFDDPALRVIQTTAPQ